MGDEKLSKKEQAFLDAKALGNDAVAAGRWADAAEAYTAALRAGPSTYWVVDGPAAAVLSNRSLAHLKCGLFEKALADAAECIALRPDWSKAHFRRGDVYRHLLHQLHQWIYQDSSCQKCNESINQQLTVRLHRSRLHHDALQILFVNL